MGDMMGSMLGGGMGGMMQGLLGGGEGGGSTSSGPVMLIPDNRLNAILAQGRPTDLDLARQLLEVIDQPQGPEKVETMAKPRFIPVENMPADEVATIIRQVFSGKLAADAGQPRQPSPQELMQALRGGGRGGRGGGAEKKSEEQKMTIGVDTRSNSLIVSAPDYLFEEVRAMVESLDIAGSQKDEVTQVVSLKGINPVLLERSLQSILGENVTVNRPTGDATTTTTARTSTQQRTNAAGTRNQRESTRPGRGPAAQSPTVPTRGRHDAGHPRRPRRRFWRRELWGWRRRGTARRKVVLRRRSEPMHEPRIFLAEHLAVTRRHLLKMGVAASALTGWSILQAAERSPEVAEAIAKLEPYFTPAEDFRDVSRGKPVPHSLPEEKKREVGLTRETWKLEVISDPENPAQARQAADEGRRHRARFRRPAEARREARRAVRQGDDLPEHRLPAGHGHCGKGCRCARWSG